MGLGPGPTAIFCGNLSPNQHLDFLFKAGRIIQREIRGFTLVILGNGPQREHVELMATRERYIRYLGPRIGREKALALKLADVFLLPGAVGLAILDSFAAGLPLLTTELATHGPEVGYLSHGNNGWITPHRPEAYAEATIRILQDPDRMQRLREAATASGHQYSIENMVENFRQGIVACLESRPVRRRSLPAASAAIPQAISDFPGEQS